MSPQKKARQKPKNSLPLLEGAHAVGRTNLEDLTQQDRRRLHQFDALSRDTLQAMAHVRHCFTYPMYHVCLERLDGMEMSLTSDLVWTSERMRQLYLVLEDTLQAIASQVFGEEVSQ